MSVSTDGSAVNVRAVIDDSSWNARQKMYVLLVSFAVIIDGFDNQVLGLTIPSLMNEWGVTRAAFAPVLALGLVGLGLGTALGGWLGDRFGRRSILILSVLWFGAFTGATVIVDNVTELTIFRFLAGLGLGATIPTSTALLAEFTPARRQMLAVAIGMACVPIGGMIGGYLSSFIIPEFGWRAMYVIGAVMPAIAALILFTVVPESPLYLAARPHTWPRLTRDLNRMLGGEKFNEGSSYTEGMQVYKAPLQALFNDVYRRDTLALWSAFFLNLLAVYIFFNWMPTMLSGLGFPTERIGFASAFFNLSGVVGAFVGVWLIGIYGARKIMAIFSIGAVVTGIVFGMLQGSGAVFIVLGLEGVFIVGGQILLFAIAAKSYPPSIRGTGVGTAVAMGRVGAIVSSFIGASLLQLDTSGKMFFWFVAGAMALTLVAVLCIRMQPQTSQA